MSYTSGYGDTGLQTISPDGVVPHTRMVNASQVMDYVRRLWQQDEKRSKKRAKVSGIVGGNPPYSPAKLRNANRADACNVNWGTAKTYFESGCGAFYDLSNEAPGMIGIITSHGREPDHRDYYSRVMSEEADNILTDDPSWDFEVQVSQEQMVAHGCGPLLFEDSMKVLPVAVHAGDLKVPERTKADTKYWEAPDIDRDYYPPDLYKFIEDPEAARLVGWDVEFTQKVIANAMDIRQPEQRAYDWEFYQQEIKNNSLSYYDDSKVCHLAFVFWKEFDGSITQALVERESTTENAAKYLFFHRGRYGSFQNCIHPMYFDRGQGGYHHAVTGLERLYAPAEYENRLLCNLCDKTFAPKIFFKPTSAEAKQKFELATFGDYGVISAGHDFIQNPIQGFLTDGLAMFRTTSELLKSNLSSYRQQVPMQQSGNPPTKFQKELEASQQSSLSKTTFNRYYRQLDLLYTEVVRRLCNLNSTDDRAKRYQKACMDRGVPRECFGRIQKVRAVRVIGQGSAFMRKTAVDSLTPVVSSLPEDGRINWLNDKIACEAGQSAVTRYNPVKMNKPKPSEQQFQALTAVTIMKSGAAPIIVDSQNPVTFASTFLAAAIQALNSIPKGADPMQVLAFLELCGPAIHAHLQRFANDPLRRPVFEELTKQWETLANQTQKLREMMKKVRAQQKDQQKKTQGVLSDEQLKARKLQGDEARKNAKLKFQLQRDSAKTKQQLAIADASTASNIHRQNAETQSRLAAMRED